MAPLQNGYYLEQLELELISHLIILQVNIFQPELDIKEIWTHQ